MRDDEPIPERIAFVFGLTILVTWFCLKISNEGGLCG